MRGAHVEHVVHGRDAGRDEAQRLVESRRTLPSRTKAGHVEGDLGVGVASPRAGGGGARSMHGGTDWTSGTANAGWGRTRNMLPMSVTLDVSRLSGWLNAYADCRVARSHVEGDTGGWGTVRGRVAAVVVHAA